MLVKTQSVFLLLFVIPIVLITARKTKLSRLHRRVIFTLLLIIAIVTLAVIIRHTSVVVDDLFWEFPILWGVAFPEISSFTSMGSEPGVIDYLKTTFSELYRQGFPWYWGVYRWLSLTLPLTIYRFIKIIFGLSILGWILGITKKRVSSLSKNISAWKVILLSSLTYTAGILAWNFLFWRSHGYSFGIQSRYFFPNIAEHMALVMGGLILLAGARFRNAIVFLAVLGMVVLNWYSWWFVASSYYDSSDLNIFFIQASQYKPWFFKTPFLMGLIGLGLISSGWFLWKMGVECLTKNKEQKTENNRR